MNLDKLKDSLQQIYKKAIDIACAKSGYKHSQVDGISIYDPNDEEDIEIEVIFDIGFGGYRESASWYIMFSELNKSVKFFENKRINQEKANLKLKEKNELEDKKLLAKIEKQKYLQLKAKYENESDV